MSEERRNGYVDLAQKVSIMSDAVIEMKFQLHRLVSDAISEKETRARTNEQILAQIGALRDAFYGSPHGDGLTLRVDRLERDRVNPDRISRIEHFVAGGTKWRWAIVVTALSVIGDLVTRMFK